MSTRFELLAALCCVAAPALGGSTDISTSRSEVQSAADTKAGETLAERFVDPFRRWRAGDEQAAIAASAIANEMCASLGRCEVPKMVAHYAALTKEQRAEGFALEQRVLGLRAELNQAHNDGLELEAWEARRIPLEREIEAARADSRELADLGARAQASALRAEYCVARLEQQYGRELNPQDRVQLAEQISKDALDAIENFEAFDMLHAALYPRWSLARIERFRGDLSMAHGAYERLASGARAVGDNDLAAEALQGLLAIAADRGDEVEGERCLEELAGVRNAQEDWPLARAWAMRRIHADRPAEALEFLNGFRAPDAADNSVDAKATCHGLTFVRAEAMLRLGQLDLAGLAATEAARLDYGPFERKFLEARVELAAGNAQAVIASIADPEWLSTLDARIKGAAHTLLGQARLELADARGAKDESERALALAEERRQLALVEPLISADETRHFNFIGEWESAGLESVALLTRANLALNDPLAAALASEDWQSRSLRGDDDELAVLSARVGKPRLHTPVTRSNLQAWASTVDLGMVTWVFGSDSSAVVHVKISPTGELDCIGESILLGREAVREAVRRLRERAIAGLDTKELAVEIRDAILPPRVLAHIGQPHASTDRLLFLLHGPLESLPFELLGLGEKHFDEELCLLTLPGLPSLEPGPRAKAEAFERWQLLGSPVDGADSDAIPVELLPGARTELFELSKLHASATPSIGAAFRRPAFERALRSADCLHIATHLVVKAGEARSRFPAVGLRLDDGDVASAKDIADLMPKPALVVLSACETGDGRYADGEGLFGVARAFLECGTRNLVVTLWPVKDTAARDFALTIHCALIDGKSPSQAVRLGRAALLASGCSSSEWAAFRFLGRD